ncbi:MAG: PatB family C-S lyase [Prevotella sp.]|nr:PatB family C-S lyase [Prevotella sp.]MBQ9223162.1 PatB family C-S lyase [Prevotella sp.]
MRYNFDKVIDRKGTNDMKNGVLEERFGRSDLLALWVADMEFETPAFIIDKLRKRLQHPILGYTLTPEELWTTIIDWQYSHHQWEIKREWLTYIPGIVKGIGMAINVFMKADEKVIIQPPVYHPFRLTPEGNKREVLYNPLILDEKTGRYRMNFEQLEELVKDPKCTMLILSNPHNPGGVVWDQETLAHMAEICYDNGVLVISDEIHCDMTLFGHKHIPYAMVSEKAAQGSITFGSPSKTFNIPGVVTSFAIVPNDEIREKFYGWMTANELNDPTIFSPIANIAAFKYGEEWRQEMLQYVTDNILFVEEFLKEHIPCIKPMRPEASFLLWLDCREMHLNHDELNDLFINKARLALNDGEMFGKEGAGFMRMNVAAPHSIIKQALEQLEEAIDNKQ